MEFKMKTLSVDWLTGAGDINDLTINYYHCLDIDQ